MSQKTVLSVAEWDINAVRYMTPKVNDKGGKSINIISSQTNRTLSISTPLLMTWGVSDYVDEKGDADGKFMISLVFPNEDYSTKATNEILHKIKKFEDKFLDDAVTNSESWFGDDMSREIVKHMFFPILKYPKNKDDSTKNKNKIDYTRPPTIKAKVPLYDGKWGVEIYDTKSNLIFPNGDPNMTPMDFIPKGSVVACVLAFSQVWIGGKGMGITAKLVQCIVKPREVISAVGKCHISLTDEDMQTLESEYKTTVMDSCTTVAEDNTIVCDSDDEDTTIPIPATIVSQVMKPINKKIIKKSIDVPSDPVVEPVVEPVVPTNVIKPNMVIKKKIVKKA